MSIEEAIERGTIKFPFAISLEKTEQLLQYVAKNLPADIHYKASYHGQFSHEECQDGSVSLSGTINHLEPSSSFDSFESILSQQDYTMISGIRFIMIPGYDLDEYRQEAVELWDQVRTEVEKYFNDKSIIF